MKKIVIPAAFLLMGATMAFAQVTAVSKKEAKIERKEANKTEVSYQTKQKFAIDFPDAKDVKYSRGDQFDEVSFTKANKKEKAYYDYEANLVGTTQQKVFSDLPEIAQKYILKEYKDYTIAKVIKFDDNEENDDDMYIYGFSFEDADNYFVELKDSSKKIVLKVDMSGEVTFFTTMR